jgi:hypothetical protein
MWVFPVLSTATPCPMSVASRLTRNAVVQRVSGAVRRGAFASAATTRPTTYSSTEHDGTASNKPSPRQHNDGNGPTRSPRSTKTDRHTDDPRHRRPHRTWTYNPCRLAVSYNCAMPQRSIHLMTDEVQLRDRKHLHRRCRTDSLLAPALSESGRVHTEAARFEASRSSVGRDN